MKKKPEAEPKKKEKTLAEAVKSIRAKFGDEAIMKLGEQPNVDVDALPTGSMGLDAALGIGGFPRGRIIEIYGPESSGKTTLALHAIAQAQARGQACAFIDAENAMDPQYAKKLGVNIDELLISQPDTGEQGLQIVDELVQSGKVGVIVIDSVAALAPKAEIEGEIGDVKIGALARLMSAGLRKLTNTVSKSKTIVIFINQLRMNIGAMATWGAPPETTTGGKALKFYASVRLDIRRIAQIKKGDDVIGGRVRVKVVKNKVAAPFKQTEFDVLYNEGISQEGELLALGDKYGIVEKGTAAYKYGDIALGRGYDASRAYLREHPDVAAEIREKVLAKVKE